MKSSMVWLLLTLIGLGTLVTAEKSLAWEFSMDGQFVSTYEYYLQQGPKGFFGRQNIDKSAGSAGALGLKPGDFASLNGWVGYRAKDLVSGSDSTQHYQYLETFPEFRINKAIKFIGKYRLGNYGDPDASDYFTNTRPGRDVATSDGQWTMWWVTAQTPWGVVVLGKRPESFGMGLQFNEQNLTCEAVMIASSYGPFRIRFGVQPFWLPQLNPRLKQTSQPYYNFLDKNGIRSLSVASCINYCAGPVDMGLTLRWFRWRAGPESQNRQADREKFQSYDTVMKCGGVYIKYNNGKFFLNSELAFWDQMTGPNATSISKVPLMTGPLYIDSWRFATELGVFSGPTKLSILYAFMPGQDRRYGKPVNKQPFVQQPLPAAYGLFRPYTYLLGYAYGSGVNAFDYDRNGYLNQAWILATRLDYAVAANLNLYGTFLWAERSSFGYGFGFIRPSQTPAVSRAVDGTGAPVDQVKYTPSVSYSDNPGAFSIPDLSLGWEAMLGMDWMLLENYRFSFLGSFWQPGRWFNYACIDRGVNSWDVPTKNNRWGVNPERVIDPVIGGEARLTVLF